MDVVKTLGEAIDLSTGGGKSLTYQIAGLYLPGTTIVISPLISLMKDQVDFLNKNKINSLFYNGSLTIEEKKDALNKIKDGNLKFIFIAPERLFVHEIFENSKDFDEFKVIVPGAGIVKSDVELSFSAKSDKLVEKALHVVEKKMKSMDGVYNISDDKEIGAKEVKLRVNEYGQLLGFSERYIASVLRPYFFASDVNKMTYDKELIDIVTQAIDKDKTEALKNFFVQIPGTLKRVRLSEIVDFTYKNSDAFIYKNDGVRVSTLYASLHKQKITSSALLKKLAPTFKKLEEQGVKISIKGEEKENKKIQKEMAEAAVIAVFLIFIALIWMFDSIILSVLVLSTIPLSLLGVLVGHWVMGMNLTMPSLLGIVGLSGVVVNDGIIMIDSLKKATNFEEMKEFATRRLRPILLTSITTVLGLGTLMFFAAGQSVILQPMAIALGFGIAWATVLNLFFVPLLFALIKKRNLKVDN